MSSDSIEVRESKFGKGLFAKKDMESGTVLCEATGIKLDFAQTLRLTEREAHTLQIDFDKYILCEPPFLYSNHSCNPNCGVNSNLELFTLKKIKAGEELLWDYSTSMLERHWTMECSCGSANCRKTIRDFDLLPKPLQEKYLQLNIVLPFIAHLLQYQRARSA